MVRASELIHSGLKRFWVITHFTCYSLSFDEVDAVIAVDTIEGGVVKASSCILEDVGCDQVSKENTDSNPSILNPLYSLLQLFLHIRNTDLRTWSVYLPYQISPRQGISSLSLYHCQMHCVESRTLLPQCVQILPMDTSSLCWLLQWYSGSEWCLLLPAFALNLQWLDDGLLHVVNYFAVK